MHVIEYHCNLTVIIAFKSGKALRDMGKYRGSTRLPIVETKNDASTSILHLALCVALSIEKHIGTYLLHLTISTNFTFRWNQPRLIFVSKFLSNNTLAQLYESGNILFECTLQPDKSHNFVIENLNCKLSYRMAKTSWATLHFDCSSDSYWYVLSIDQAAS